MINNLYSSWFLLRFLLELDLFIVRMFIQKYLEVFSVDRFIWKHKFLFYKVILHVNNELCILNQKLSFLKWHFLFLGGSKEATSIAEVVLMWQMMDNKKMNSKYAFLIFSIFQDLRPRHKISHLMFGCSWICLKDTVITYMWLYIFLISRQDQFFRWLEELPWTHIYLDFFVRGFLLWKFLEYLSQSAIQPTDHL